MKIAQSAVNAGASRARDHYLRMSRSDARLDFAFQLQGFVASEVGRGSTIKEACGKIAELMMLLGDANEVDLMQEDN